MSKNENVSAHLLKMAFPLMLCSLSGMAMLFVNRLILAGYSLEAHNASVEAMNLGWAFIAGWVSLVSIVQVFVAQNFGAERYQMLGRFTWQMIWVSLISGIMYIPIAFWGPDFFYGSSDSQELKRIYFFWMVLFGPLHVLFAALSSFFVGQKKVKLIIIVDIIGNALNSLLSYFLVFGIEGMISPMGAKGAAIGTNIALSLQVMMLICAYLHPKNCKQFGTLLWKWDTALIVQCCKVGSPNALFSMLEVAGWATFYSMMAILGEKHLTIAGIVQNVLILFNFLGEGISRAVSVLCGNALGRDERDAVYKYVRGGIWIMTFFAGALGILLWSTKEMIAEWFLVSLSETQRELFYPALVFGLFNVVIYKYLEGIRLVIGGALTAAADTYFLLIGGTFSIWLFMVLPIYQFVLVPEASIETALVICSLYTFISASIYAWRFYFHGWQKNTSLVLQPS